MTWDQFLDVLPIVTLIAGILLGFFAEWGHDRRRSQRERSKWAAEFQRDSLLQLQDLLDERQISIENLISPRIDSWNSQPDDGSRVWPPIESFSKDMRHDAHIRRLTVATSARIDNEEIRQVLAVFSEAGDRTIAGPRADTADAMEEWRRGVVNPQVERVDELQRLIGEQLRSKY